MSNNFFWLSGNRFLCMESKNNIISKAKSKDKVEIIDINSYKYNDVMKIITDNPLFGNNTKIMVCEDKLPKSKNIYNVLKKLPSDRIVIYITNSVNKKSKEYEELSEYLQYFPNIKDRYGNIDNKTKKQVSDILKKKTGWQGSNVVFDFIVGVCNHDVGSIYSEIEKIKIYNNSTKVNKISEVLPIIYNQYCPTIDDIFKSIFINNFGQTNYKIKSFIKNSKDDDLCYTFFYTIKNRLFIMFDILLLKENGIEDNLYNLVYKSMKLKYDKSNKFFISKKVDEYLNLELKNITTKDILELIDMCENNLNDFINNRGSPSLFYKRFIYKIISIAYRF